MKLLTNSSGAYLTGDEIADAVQNYGAALANEQRVDLVDIPYIVTDDHGAVSSVRLTVGWRAEVNSAHQMSERTELLDDALLRDLSTRTTALYPNGDTPLDPDDIAYLRKAEEFL